MSTAPNYPIEPNTQMSEAERHKSSRPVGFKEAIRRLFSNYANFKGTASRSEYWYATLGLMIVMWPLSILNSIGTQISLNQGEAPLFYTLASVVYLIFCLVTFIPSLSLCVRRLHDIGRRWFSYLFVLIPLVGPFIVLWFFVKPSDNVKNQPWRIYNR